MTTNRTMTQQNSHAEALCWFLSVFVAAIVIAVCYVPSQVIFWSADSVGMRQQFAHKVMLCLAAAATLVARYVHGAPCFPRVWSTASRNCATA
jgi:hypothetical protein